MKKAKFIINPSSGKQNFIKQTEEIAGCLILNQIVNQIDVVYTKQEHDARIEAEKIKQGEYDFLMAVGGDGTLGDVINGVIKGRSEVPIAILPAGLTNSFAATIGTPTNHKEAFCEMILNFKTKDIDVGRANGDYFINMLAGGLLADVGYRVDKESKLVLGRMAYLIEGAKELPKKAFTSFRLAFECEEYNGEDDVLLFVAANTGNIAGMKDFVPDARLDDSLLDIAIFEKMDIGELSMLLIKFLQGEHLRHSKVKYFQTKKLKIHGLARQDVPIDCDGEQYQKLPIVLKAYPKAVKIIVP